MITGSYSIVGKSASITELMAAKKVYEGLTFHAVASAGFSGGYYLNDRLPYTTDDHFYSDINGDIFILLSGSLYNSNDLKERAGIDRQMPDPELIACLFIEKGPGFVKDVNGDFALFVLLPQKGEAFLYRDHVGIRPLAYSFNGEALRFSADVIGLCRALSFGEPPEAVFLMGYFKYVDYHLTPNNNVHKLPPGHYLHISGGGVTMVRYWNPASVMTDRHLRYDQMISDLKTLIHDAVAIRCDRRFNAGAHVSSGIDSGIVAVLARKEYNDQVPFHGFSWSPDGYIPGPVKYDERDLVKILCKQEGIKPLFSDMTPHLFREHVSEFYNNMGYFFDERIIRQAADTGTNLIFSGWGGDEFISTGDRGIETDLLTGLRLRAYFRRNRLRPFKRFVKYFLQYTLYPALGILPAKVESSFSDDARYLLKRYRKSDRRAIRNFYFHTSRRQMHLRYLKFYHLQERCESWFASGYRGGVEYRYPLLDRRIIEYMVKIPSSLLCRDNIFRPLLRVIGKGILPEEVRLNTGKKDHVFSAYWDELLKDSAGQLIDEAEHWRHNPDLCFVDFDLLMNDTEKFRNDPESIDQKSLFRALIYIKAINEFSKQYRDG